MRSRLRTYRQLLARTYKEALEDHIMLLAAGASFFMVLALIPGLALLVWVMGLLGREEQIGELLPLLSGILPDEALGAVEQEVNGQQGAVGAQGGEGLQHEDRGGGAANQDGAGQEGRGAPEGARVEEAGGDWAGAYAPFVGAVFLLWTANMGTKGLFNALNAIFDAHENRGYFHFTAVTLGYTIGFLALVAAGIAAALAVPGLAEDLGTAGGFVLEALRWLIMVGAVGFGIAALYRFAPNRGKDKEPWLTWGGVLAALAWALMSLAYSFWAADLGGFDETYGRYAGIMIFLFWLWLSVLIVLAGAELDAAMRKEGWAENIVGASAGGSSRENIDDG